MDYESILYTVEEGTLTITLNRPDVLNAFNSKMGSELLDALKKAERDASVRAIVLTGAGRAFSAGEDLKARQAEGITEFGSTLRDRYNPIVLKLRSIEKPILASVNGVAAGAGCSLALACDMRIASEKASFLEAFVRVGLVLDSGASFFLPRLVGMGKAAEMAFLGDTIKADEALVLGLVNRVVPHDDLESATKELAARLAVSPTKAIGLMKRAMNRALTAELVDVLEYEVYAQEAAGNTDDHKEGMSAFLEKRQPKFTGK